MKIASAPPKLLEARRGGEFVLECSARGRPAPEVTWLKNGIPLHDQVRASIYDIHRILEFFDPLPLSVHKI